MIFDFYKHFFWVDPCQQVLNILKIVFTAAHCFDEIVEEEEYADIKITLGEWKIDTKIDCEEDSDADVCDKVAVIPLKSINIHESYDKVSKDKNSYDIAIITLKRPPRKSEIIDSIKLPTEDSCDYSGKLVTVTGFGKFSLISRKYNLQHNIRNN